MQETTSEQPTARRIAPARKRTLSVKRTSKTELRRLAVLYPDDGSADLRPRTRSECADTARPCPWAGCRYHLAVDVQHNGGLTENFPGAELEELLDTCALDVADRGGQTLEQVAQRMNLTRERVRQIESRALLRLPRKQLAQFLQEVDEP